MFGFIRKKKIEKFICEIASKTYGLSENFSPSTSDEEHRRKIYANGFEAGTMVFFYAIIDKFNLRKGLFNDIAPERTMLDEIKEMNF